MNAAGRRSGSVPLLYGLVLALVVLPLAVLAAGLVVTWRSTLASARQDLRRSLAVATEQATRVLDSHLLIAARVNDLTGKLDDAQIVANEAPLRDNILAMIRRFPQISDVVLIGSRGKPLLATAQFPVNRQVDFSGKPCFVQLRDGARRYYIGPAMTSRISHALGFSLAIRRGTPDGAFRGIVVITVSPTYFEDFYATLLGARADYAAGLYRDDGRVLARYPAHAPYDASQPHQLLLRAIADLPVYGTVRGDTAPDRIDKLLAYRRLDDYPVYAVVARSWNSISSEWWGRVRVDLLYGAPLAVGMVLLGLLAARRARRESNALAELREEVRRRETAEAALRQAQKMEAVGRLTGGVAHDFNNHLTVISSNIELLKRRLGHQGDSVLRLADGALQGVQRAAALTQRLLAFSRQQPLEPEPLNAGQLVQGMLDLLRRTLEEGIAIRTELADELWLTKVDSNQLENALLNVAVNARDAMPDGGTLTIAASNVLLDGRTGDAPSDLPAGPYVVLSVTDTGHGMTPDVLAKAFEPFFTTKPVGQGSGLGLSMVYGFVRQSGGQVQLRSEPGQGCTVRMYLPRHVPEPAAAPAPVRRSPARKGAGETILVVEDDEAVRRSTVEALRDLGYTVLEAPDAMDAFRLIVDRGGIDLVFTDVGLPGGVTGRALADAVRNVSSDIRLLFTTGYAGLAHQGGTVPVLTKPFDLGQLGGVVRAVLDAPAQTVAGRGTGGRETAGGHARAPAGI